MNQEAEIVAVEGKVSGERRTRVFFQRKAVHDLMAQLNNTLQDAMVEIAIAPQLYDNPGSFRMMNYGRVSGMSAGDLTAYQLTVKKTYQDWCKRLTTYSPTSLSIAKRVCQEEQSINQIRTGEYISEKTAVRLLQYALNEYSILAGWGNQIT